jgi:hypothetical protein
MTGTPNPLDLAYLAGVIDSDGTIGIGIDRHRGRTTQEQTVKSPRFFEFIACSQMETEALELMVSTFGKKIYNRKPRGNSKTGMFCWSLNNIHACTAISALLPYLRIKRRQAEIVLKLRSIKDRGRIANTEQTERTYTYKGRWGNRWTQCRRMLKPEVIAEYEELARQTRALNRGNMKEYRPDNFVEAKSYA